MHAQATCVIPGVHEWLVPEVSATCAHGLAITLVHKSLQGLSGQLLIHIGLSRRAIAS